MGEYQKSGVMSNLAKQNQDKADLAAGKEVKERNDFDFEADF